MQFYYSYCFVRKPSLRWLTVSNFQTISTKNSFNVNDQNIENRKFRHWSKARHKQKKTTTRTAMCVHPLNGDAISVINAFSQSNVRQLINSERFASPNSTRISIFFEVYYFFKTEMDNLPPTKSDFHVFRVCTNSLFVRRIVIQCSSYLKSLKILKEKRKKKPDSIVFHIHIYWAILMCLVDSVLIY